MELKKYWEIICRRKKIILYAVVLMVVFTNLILLVTPTIYKSNAKLIFNMQEIEPFFMAGVPNEISLMRFVKSENAVGTIEELIESAPVIEGAINEMGLKDSDGEPLLMSDFLDPSFLKLLSKKAGVDINNLEASETFEIIGYSDDTATARDIAENVYENFIHEFSKRYRNEMLNAKKVIEKRLLDVKTDLTDAELKVVEYKASNKFYIPTSQISSLLNRIEALKGEKNTARRALSESEAGIYNIKKASWMENQDFKDVWVKIENNAMIEYYKKQLQAYETTLAQLLTERTPEHPDVKLARNNIEITTKLLQTETLKHIGAQIAEGPVFYTALAQDYVDGLIKTFKMNARLTVLDNQISAAEEELGRLPDKERQLSNLSAKTDSLKSVYMSLLVDLENINSALEMDIANVLLFQPPTEGSRYFPQLVQDDWLTYSVLAVAVGLTFGLFFAFLLNYLDSTVGSEEDVRNMLGQETVAVFPRVENLTQTINPDTVSPFSGKIHDLFARMRLADKNLKILTLVSPSDGDGKSAAAGHIAHVMARSGKKVVLVDGNLREPAVHKMFGLAPSKGFSEYLLGQAGFEEIISHTTSGGLDVITAGSAVLNEPQGYLQSDLYPQLVKSLVGYYDLVIFDTPSCASGNDSLILSSCDTKVLLLIREGMNPLSRIKSLMDSLTKIKTEIAGVILNDVR